MAEQPEYPYDVFVSYSPEDRAWVEKWLLPRLEQAELRVFDHDDFIVGMPRLENIERAVELSRRTIVVLTPAWLASEWNAFEAMLVRASDPAARRRRLIPVLLKPCELPDALRALEPADFTAESHWTKEARRLTRDLRDLIPVRFPPAQRRASDLGQWRKWLRYRRRALRRTAAALLALGLAVTMSLQVWPFQRRMVWRAEALIAPHATLLHNTGKALIVGAANPEKGCSPPRGLWYRPLAPGAGWRASELAAPICIEDRQALSDFVALASPPGAPDTVYALTSHSGLLVSDDAGARFVAHPAGMPLERENLPALLAVSGVRTPTLWVAGEESGLFAYQGDRWSRLDDRGTCAGLPRVRAGALLATDRTIMIGGDRKGLWLSEDGGRTCRQVFDRAGRYDFFGLWDVSKAPQPGEPAHQRYLALARDSQAEQDAWHLLDICPRLAACREQDWQADSIWTGTPTVEQALVQEERGGDYAWYLVTALGEVWRGDLKGGPARQLPRITRCLPACEAALAPSGDGTTPYLLAADHVYQYAESDWWRRLWP